MRSPRRHLAVAGARVGRGAVIVIVALAALGCDSGSDGSSGVPSEPAAATEVVVAPSPTPAAPTASLRPSERATDRVAAAVLEAYLGYWDAILAANDPPDERHPGLKRYATGEAYESVFNAAQTNRLAGRVLRLPQDSVSEHRARVIAVDGDEAKVRDCAVDDGLVVDRESGRVLDDDVVTRLVTGTLVRDAGAWKVSHTRIDRAWDGVAGCAAE